ncbi:aspartic peptidase domain-containing protein [Thelonectria olida]|uniref:Aspartic peptidase domain-containing protein n=1 Tax=Thelonectria olida TaxID=1576542 RepID=A0A9P8W0W4_9HYPO|nr:aspartic peptidase domain-containing protein [Thelonectria olida]
MLSTLFSLAALPILAQAIKIPDDNRLVQEPGLIRFPLRVTEGAPILTNITKRQNDVDLKSQKTGNFYSIDLVLGTPGQKVSVNFDTGSSELWVNPICSKSNDPDFCNSFGRFTQSSSFASLGVQGSVTYGTGYVDFDYGYDYVALGPAKISQQIFGVAYDSEFAVVGIMGAGPDLGGWNNDYPLLIDSLAQQGFTNSRAFSLDIRSLESSRGSVIFGGIDTRKYSGHLEKRPIVPADSSPDGNTRYWVNVDGIALSLGDGSKKTIFSEVNGLTVLLDSGYTLSALPGPIFQPLVDNFPTAKPIQGTRYYEVDCSVGDTEGTLDYTFGETVIKVPYNDFIWHLSGGLCVLGAFQDDEFPVLGDTFLRAAYVVYDWDNENIHLANNEDCGSNLVAIGTGPDSVPSLVGECRVAQTTTTELSSTTTTTTTSAEPTTTSTEETSTEPTSTPTETPTGTPTETSTEPTTTPVETSTQTPVETCLSSTDHDRSSDLSTVTAVSSTKYYNVPGAPTTVPGTTVPVTLTSTIKSTQVYTITSCPPSVTNCPIGSLTTKVITSYTTYCPEADMPKPPVTSLTSTYTSTRTYTITDCPGEGPCHKGELTTEIYTSTTLVRPETTATYTVHKTISCGGESEGCVHGSKTMEYTVTIKPATKNAYPTSIPGCSTCTYPSNGKDATFTAAAYFTPTAKVATVTRATAHSTYVEPTGPPVVTAGAAWNAPGVAAVAMGALFAAAI